MSDYISHIKSKIHVQLIRPHSMRFEVITEMSLTFSGMQCWVTGLAAPYILKDHSTFIFKRKGPSSLRVFLDCLALKMKALWSFETTWTTHEIAKSHISEDRTHRPHQLTEPCCAAISRGNVYRFGIHSCHLSLPISVSALGFVVSNEERAVYIEMKIPTFDHI